MFHLAFASTPFHLFLLMLPLTFAYVKQEDLAENYSRAQELSSLFQNKVFKTRVFPHWFSDNNLFWYKNELPDDGREFMLVDTVNARRSPAFDHKRLATALSKTLGSKIQPNKLPVEGIEFKNNMSAVLLSVDERTLECDLATYAIKERPDIPPPLHAIPCGRDPHASYNTGANTTITFLNKTDEDAVLYWINSEGQKVEYGSIPSGGRRKQNSYAGHMWLVTDKSGKMLGVFEATADPGLAIIDGKLPPLPPASTSNPPGIEGTLSPDGKWSAFIKDYNLWIQNTTTKIKTQLSTDGVQNNSYGADFQWSPDSSRIVALRTEAGEDHEVYFVESSPPNQVQPILHHIYYLKPGDKIPIIKPHLFDVTTAKEIPIIDTLFYNPWSITEVRWEPDSSRFTFVYNQRGHQVMRVIGVDAKTGYVQAIVNEECKTFFDYAGKYFCEYLPETDEIIWMSERDGWNHLYLYDSRTGIVKNQITKGEWVVRGVDKVDHDKREIWFRAGGIHSKQDPYYIHYCRIGFDGVGLTVMTSGDGTHTVSYSPDRRYFVDSYSRVDLPPVSELRDARDGKLICLLEKADAKELYKTGWTPPIRFTAKGRDGVTDIYGVIWKPLHYSPDIEYPVIENIYAGPQDSYVPKNWNSYYYQQVVAEIGFIVVQIDGMGTSNRSKAFHDVCWKNLKDAGFPDRIPWIKAAKKVVPNMDTEHVGIWGISAGGQNALGALIFHPEFYKVAHADSGCHDNRMDKIWWNELWMSWPVGPQYAESSNVVNAYKMQGKLLITFGEVDTNVDPASSMQVVNALIKAGKDFEMIDFPGMNHGAGDCPYGKRKRIDLFVRNLLGLEPPAFEV